VELSTRDRQLVTALKARLVTVFGERLRGVKVFGSRARGTARPDSDLDVLVLLDEADTATRYKVFGLVQEVMLEADTFLLSPRVLGESDFAALLALERRLALDIESEGIAV